MKKVIEVYHGSNISVQKPSLSFGRSDAKERDNILTSEIIRKAIAKD